LDGIGEERSTRERKIPILLLFLFEIGYFSILIKKNSSNNHTDFLAAIAPFPLIRPSPRKIAEGPATFSQHKLGEGRDEGGS